MCLFVRRRDNKSSEFSPMQQFHRFNCYHKKNEELVGVFRIVYLRRVGEYITIL